MDKLAFNATITGNAIQNLDDILARLGKLKDEYTIKISLQEESMVKFKEAVEQLNTDGMKGFTNSMKEAMETMAKSQRTMKDFAGVSIFEDVPKQLQKVKAEFDSFMAQWNKGQGGTVNANAMQNALGGSLDTLKMMVNNAWAQIGKLDETAAQKYQAQLKTDLSGLGQSIGSALQSNLITSNFNINKVFEEVKAKIENMATLSKNQGPMSGYILDTVRISALLANAFQTVESRIATLKNALANNEFDKLATSARNAAEAVEKLNTNFGPLLATLGKNTELHNFMTGLGEVVNTIRLLTRQQNFGAGSMGGLDKFQDNIDKNRRRIDGALYDIRTALAETKAAFASGQANGMNERQLTKMREYIDYYKQLQTEMRKAKDNTALMSQAGGASSVISPTFSKEMGMAKGFTQQAKEYEQYMTKLKMDKAQLESFRTSFADLFKNLPTTGLAASMLTPIKQAIGELGVLQKQMDSLGTKDASKLLGKGWGDQFDALIQKTRALIENEKVMNELFEKASNLQARAQGVLNTASGISGNDLFNATAKSSEIDTFVEKITKLSADETANAQVVQALVAEYNKLAAAFVTFEHAQEKANAAQDKRNGNQAARSDKERTDSIEKAAREYERLEKILAKARATRDTAVKLDVDITGLNEAINKIETLKAQMEIIKNANLGNGYYQGQTAKQILGSTTTIEQLGELERKEHGVAEATKAATQAQKEAEAAARKKAQANQQQAQSENELAQAIQKATQNAGHQSQVMSDLKSMAMQYASVWGAWNFAQEIAQTTGELELQEKSLEVILGNASKAQEMYAEIRDLSQMSPFTFQDLMKSTRQLAAFGIETKDLYGTMKSLSDIGAGLNVDVNRLILAYGHTRSYGYLSGIQNRQFENAGIDMIGGLMELYNKQAQKAQASGGVANFVTRKDIFSRMREKSIPFEDVETVINQLDQPGGKFFNMQEKQFDTLGGKLRNLKNNYNIMLSEIGKANHGLLTGVVGMINNVTENWEKYKRLLYDVVAALGAMKVAQIAVGASAMTMNKQLAASALMSAKNTTSAAYLNNYNAMGSAVGNWSSRNLAMLGIPMVTSTSGQVTQQDVRAIAKNKEINNLTKQRIALTGSLNREQRQYLLTQSGVNAAQAETIAGLSRTRRGILALRLAFIEGATAAKAFMVSLLTNPITWLMAVVAGVTALVQKLGETSKQAENIKNNIHEAAQTDIQGINQAIEPYGSVYSERGIKADYKDSGHTSYLGKVAINQANLEAQGVQTVFEELQKSLQAQAPLYNMSLFDIYKFNDEEKQVEAIIQKLKDIEYVKTVQDRTRDAFANSIASTGGITEGIITNTKDYDKWQKAALEEIKVITDKKWSEVSKEDKKAIMDYANELKVTREQAILLMTTDIFNQNKFAKSLKGNSTIDYNLENLKKAETTMRLDMQPVAREMASEFSNAYAGDPELMKEAFNANLLQMLTESNISDDLEKANYSDQFAIALRDELIAANDKTDANGFISNYYKSLFTSLIQEGMSGVNESTSPEELQKIIATSITNASESVHALYPRLTVAFKGLGKKATEGFDEEMKNWAQNLGARLSASAGWQTDLKNKANNNPDLVAKIKMAADWTGFWESAKKELDTNLKKLQEYAKKAKIDLGMNISITQDPTKLKAMMDAASKKLEGLKSRKQLLRNFDPTLEGQIDAAQQIFNLYKSIYDTVTLAKADHVNLDDINKKSNSTKKTNTNKEDPEKKKWDARIKVLNEAYDAYKQWEKLVGDMDAEGKDPAMKIVEGKFGKELREAFKGFKIDGEDFKIEDIKGFQNLLNKIYDAIGQTKFKQKETKTNLQSQIKGRISQTQVATIQEDAAEIESAVTKTLDNISDKYKNFRTILEATGSTSIASMVLGEDYEWENKAEVIKDEIQSVLNKAELRGYDFLGAVDAQMDNKSIETLVKKYIPSVDENNKPIEENIAKINSVVKALEDWRDIQKEIFNDSVSGYAETLKGLSSYLAQITRIKGEYENAVSKNKSLTPEAQQRGNDIAYAKMQRQLLEASPMYKNLLNSPLTTTRDAGRNAARYAVDVYNKNFQEGLMDADEYTKKIKELNDALVAIDDGAVDEWLLFLEGGMKSVREQRIKKDDEIIAKSAREYAEADADYKIAEQNGNNYAMLEAQGRKDAAKKAMNDAQADKEKNQGKNTSEIQLDRAIQAIVNSLQKFINALGLVNDVIGSLGLSKTKGGKAVSAAASIGSSMLSGASSLSMLGPYGMAAGAALGLVSGVAKVHDQQLQEKIDDLQEDISKIESYTETISKSRERALGYDSGSILSRYQEQWNNTYSSSDALGYLSWLYADAAYAMRDYYKAASEGINGYQQEYELLIQKRQNYMDMYDAEAQKKNTSQEQLAEYQSQIADLDDQIAYFTEDLAKDLWGIDIQDWADQFADALSSAWENGTSAAEAYGDTVRSILQSLGKQMMQESILEPMFSSLETTLFGEDGKGGLFNMKDVDGSMSKVIDYLGQFFGDGGEGQKTITAATEFWDGIEQILNQYGLSAKESGSSSLSTGISGMSEETADILAGYINSLRQDVSVMRILQQTFYNDYWPEYKEAYTSAYRSVANIEQDVAAMRRVQSDMATTLSDFYSKFRNVINGTDKVYVQ